MLETSEKLFHVIYGAPPIKQDKKFRDRSSRGEGGGRRDGIFQQQFLNSKLLEKNLARRVMGKKIEQGIFNTLVLHKLLHPKGEKKFMSQKNCPNTPPPPPHPMQSLKNIMICALVLTVQLGCKEGER